MRRREFITLLGGATTLSFATSAQQPTKPVVGFLNGGVPGPYAPFVVAFRQGLTETSYVEGMNVAIEYRWAEGHYERLPALAADLVSRKVDVIAACGGDLAARAAKNATSTIPIVFTSGDDPVATGLVVSLSHPGGNLTGISFLIVELHAKRLELVTELVPQARVMALLVNPNSPQIERVTRAMQQAASAKGMQLHVLSAAKESEIDSAFTALAELRSSALVVQADPFFISRRERLTTLAAHYAVPTIYEGRQFVEAGGLISYGPSFTAIYHHVGVYTGRILKGEKPADLRCSSRPSSI